MLTKEEKKNRLALACLIIAALFFAYLAVSTTVERSGLGSGGTLVVGVNVPFPPFEEVQNGRVVGIDADIADAIGEKLGRKVEFRNIPDYDAVLPSLNKDSGAIDVAISAITITPSRSESVDFSIPYYEAAQAALVMKNGGFGSKANLTAEDFRSCKVGFQEATTSQAWVEDNLYGKVDLAGNESFQDMRIGLQSLRAGKVDVLILDKPVAQTFARNYADLAVAGTMETWEQYGIAVKKGDPENILGAINETILEMKQDGRYEQMIKKHTGV